MFLPLRTKLIYELSYIEDCRTFLESMPIGGVENQVFIFAGLEASHPANHVLNRHSLPADEFVRDALQTLKNEEFPNAVVHKVRYSSGLMAELLKTITTSDNPTDFCRHVVGFAAEEPWFSFHDAFGDVLQVSGDCIQEEVTRVASANKASVRVTANPCLQ